MFHLYSPTIPASTATSGLITALANTVNNVIHESNSTVIEEVRAALEEKDLLTAEIDAVLVHVMNHSSANYVTVPGVPKPRSYASVASPTDEKSAVVEETVKPAKVRKPRVPTYYNNYIQSKIAELKTSMPELVGKDFMKVAIEHWNADKAAGKIPVPVKKEEVEPSEKKRRGRPPKNASAVAVAVVSK